MSQITLPKNNIIRLTVKYNKPRRKSNLLFDEKMNPIFCPQTNIQNIKTQTHAKRSYYNEEGVATFRVFFYYTSTKWLLSRCEDHKNILKNKNKQKKIAKKNVYYGLGFLANGWMSRTELKGE